MRYAYSSIFSFFVKLEANLIQSTISVSGAGYVPETHRMAFLHDQELVMRRASTLPYDLIVVSFMIMVIGECVEG